MIFEILKRVPKKSWLRFRRMSKSWRRVIDSCVYKKSLLYLFPMNSSRLYHINLRHPGGVVKIKNPCRWKQTELLGSCKRYLCVANVADHSVAIWTPSASRRRSPSASRHGRYRRLRLLRVLPPVDTQIPHELSHVGYGFGYDRSNKEYVLLKVVQTLQRPIVSEVSIYRERANLWRPLQGMPYFLVEQGRMGVYLHGRLHWIMKRSDMRSGSAKVLAAFDFRTENFVEVDLPNLIDNRLCMNLAVLRQNLCLIIYGVGVVDMWIMRKYGLNRSWRHLLHCNQWWRLRRVWPLAYSWGGGRVWVEVGGKDEPKRHFLYNLRTNKDKPFHIKGMRRSFLIRATCLL